jgi:hypothetical protein
MPLIQKLAGWLLKFPLSGAAADVAAVRADMVGEKMSDFGVIEKRKDLTGAPLETTLFAGRRREGIFIFLGVKTSLTGSTSKRTYPMGPNGIGRLYRILNEESEAFRARPEDSAPEGLLGRFVRWLKMPLRGAIIESFGTIDEVDLQSSEGVPSWGWEQSVEAQATRKKGENLLVLTIRYKAPGWISGTVCVPFGQEGRTRLVGALEEIRQQSARSGPPSVTA